MQCSAMLDVDFVHLESELAPACPTRGHALSRSLTILPCSLLASLKLLHVPPTDVHVSLVLLHALCEALDVVCTWSLCLRLRTGVVETRVHRLSLLGVIVDRLLVLLLFRRSSRRSTTEEAAERVTNG